MEDRKSIQVPRDDENLSRPNMEDREFIQIPKDDENLRILGMTVTLFRVYLCM